MRTFRTCSLIISSSVYVVIVFLAEFTGICACFLRSKQYSTSSGLRLLSRNETNSLLSYIDEKHFEDLPPSLVLLSLRKISQTELLQTVLSFLNCIRFVRQRYNLYLYVKTTRKKIVRLNFQTGDRNLLILIFFPPPLFWSMKT